MGFYTYSGELRRARARLGTIHRRPPCRFCGSRFCHDVHLDGKRWEITRCSGCNRECSMSRTGWFTHGGDSGVHELLIPYIQTQFKGRSA